MATNDRRGTVAVGRPLPIRSGQITTAVVASASRTVAGAATITRSGSTVAANAPSGSRTVTPLGTTYARSGALAVGRIPRHRSGITAIGHTLTGSRVVGNPGVMFDRAGTFVVGRVASSRTGTITSASQPAASRVVTPAGVFDRTGGKAGGAGQSNGLLLALQAHPGATLSATRSVGTTVPARSGIVISTVALSGGRVTDRSRTGAIIVVHAPAASRLITGNRNRNGFITVVTVVAASWTLGRLNLVGGTISIDLAPSGSRAIGVTPIYLRSSIVGVSTQLTGSVAARSGFFERAATVDGRTVFSGTIRRRPFGSKTYIFQPISTGRVAVAEEDGVVV